MNLKKLIFASLLFIPNLSFAIFCPTNFSQINYGDSMDKVTQICGKPDKQETKDLEPKVPQEWSYFIPQTVGQDTSVAQQGTLKTQITFDSDGKVINISVNGLGVGASTICGSSIKLGDLKNTVKAACGEPSFINSQTNPNAKGGITGT